MLFYRFTRLIMVTGRLTVTVRGRGGRNQGKRNKVNSLKYTTDGRFQMRGVNGVAAVDVNRRFPGNLQWLKPKQTTPTSNR